MKDAKGHGSDPRGTHSMGIQQVGQPQHWFDRSPTDPYVYHGTTADHLGGIKEKGLDAFLRTYFASDPKIAMRYGFRSNLHHDERGRGQGGVLLRVRKEHVDPDLYRVRGNQDFWTGPSNIPADKIEARIKGKWGKL